MLRWYADRVHVVRVISDDVVTSPVSGRKGAFVRLELVEDGEARGAVVLGDIVRLAGEGRELHVVVRRARIVAPTAPHVPLLAIVPELAALLRSTRGGALSVREHVVACGDLLRVARDGTGELSLFLP